MISKWQKRLWLVAFFIGFNLVLGSYFLSEVRADLPKPLAQLLYNLGIAPHNARNLEEVIHPPDADPDLAVIPLVNQINLYREQHNLPPLKLDDQLTAAAQQLLKISADAGFDTNANFKSGVLEESLKESGYQYEWVSHNALVGPRSNAAVMTAWLSDSDQTEALENKDFEDIGLAVMLADSKENGQIGLIVQLLGKPSKGVATKSQQTTQTKTSIPEAKNISDQEVIDALNGYRQTHGIKPLAVHPSLCEYAAKRARDLKIAGGLDNHQGFQSDFADPDNLPVGIKDYPRGRKIGENLAHQYCRNMTTGESFVAQSGTALIEWCFDSSTKGHREAQLSKEFKNVCVRHADNMYVVIFGS